MTVQSDPSLFVKGFASSFSGALKAAVDGGRFQS
jgi:hypothetical protein